MTRIQRAVALAILGLVGCGDAESSVALVPVKGTVTLNGKPMPNAQVSFIPGPGNMSNTAGGDTTGPEGNYTAKFKGRSGLAPGKYKVTIAPGVSSSSEGVSDAFKDDPFMAAEGTRAASSTRGSAKKPEIRGDFDAEVDSSGSPLNFNIKAASAAASARK